MGLDHSGVLTVASLVPKEGSNIKPITDPNTVLIQAMFSLKSRTILNLKICPLVVAAFPQIVKTFDPVVTLFQNSKMSIALSYT